MGTHPSVTVFHKEDGNPAATGGKPVTTSSMAANRLVGLHLVDINIVIVPIRQQSQHSHGWVAFRWCLQVRFGEHGGAAGVNVRLLIKLTVPRRIGG